MSKFEYPKHAFQPLGGDGMELRDWFAGLAMQALLHELLEYGEAETQAALDAVSKDAYAMADAMLEARSKDPKS